MATNSTSETEIKLAATPAMLTRLRQGQLLAGDEQRLALRTTYFDSADRRLAKAGIVLRVRQQGGRFELTAKTPGPGASAIRRGEWTVPLENQHLQLAALPARLQSRIRKALGDGRLEPVAGNRIARLTRQVRHGGSVIEVAFDTGRITAGPRSEAVSEIELELAEGRMSDLLALALTLPLGPELQWSILSKGERGDLLARDAAPEPVHAAPAPIGADHDAATAFRLIAWGCLEQLLANYRLVIANADDEALHQCRVAMRRWLAAWALFGAVTKDEARPHLRAGLKAAARSLGAARDLHVLHQHCAASAAADDALAGQALAHLALCKAEAMKAAQDVLLAAPFQRLLFDCALWLEAGTWRERPQGAEPIQTFARRLLAKRHRKLHRSGKPLARLSGAALHRLRKRGKQLRYAVEFFEPLWPAAEIKSRKAALHRLRKLQDRLGEIHDGDVAGAIARGTLRDGDPVAMAELAVTFDALLMTAKAERKAKVHAAQKALDKVRVAARVAS